MELDFENLLSWYQLNCRTMPWRESPTPYRVWLSEMMLQQTQVDTVIPYFQRFINRFPTLESLSDASLENVLQQWEGLGYYARAKNLHKTAQIIVQNLKGKFPNSFIELKQLPGMGPYSAAAVASIAFGESVPAVDGNVLRVFARCVGYYGGLQQESFKKQVFNELQTFIDQSQNPSRFNQAMMELGALVCKPKHPCCLECPLKKNCIALKLGTQNQIPSPKLAKKRRIRYGIVLFIKTNMGFFMSCSQERLWHKLWIPPILEISDPPSRFPFSKISCLDCGKVKVIRKFKPIQHELTHYRYNLYSWLISVEKKLDYPWVEISDAQLAEIPVPSPIRELLQDPVLNKKKSK